ncbi:MAG TPA: type II secretion system protein [Tepidisphaeraceae bacterium]|nr:type II secretion system protein [Tepidisphaeraceae bacterium]
MNARAPIPAPAHLPRRAFTLVEILCCVVILGIAAAVIVPSIGDRDDLKVSAASRIVMADLMYAQNRAITTQTKHYVVFNATNTPRSYQIVTSVTPLVAVTHPLTKASSYVATFGTGGTAGLTDVALDTVSFEGKTTIAFDELGVPYYYDPGTNTTTALSVSAGSTIKLTSGKFSLTITIEPYTGEIKVD